MKAHRAKYAFDKRSDSELQLWPGTSTEKYVTRPFVSARVFGGRGRGKRPLFFWPEFSGGDPLARYGILAAARTSHFSGYYQSRTGADFHLAMYTVDGGARLSSESEKFSLAKNSFALIPAGCPYELGSRPSGWKVVWFHISGGVPLPPRARVYASGNCARLRGIFGLYEDEIYSSAPSAQVLEPLAEAIFSLLRSDMVGGGRTGAGRRRGLENSRGKKFAFAELDGGGGVEIFRASPKAPRRALQAEVFRDVFEDFARVAHGRGAQNFVRPGATLSETAAKVGYADAFCFSKAFKRHFGRPPGELRGK